MHKRKSPHGDYDNIGEGINLVNNFKVEKVIFFCVMHNIYCAVSYTNLRLYRWELIIINSLFLTHFKIFMIYIYLGDRMVYIDLLVLEDLLINYVILYTTGIILNRITKFKKIFLSSSFGTIPLIFLFCNLNNYLISIITFLFSIIMSIIAFSYKDIIYTVKNVIYMYLISVFLAGSIYLINTNFLPEINNYLLSVIILLILSPIITYIYIKSIDKIKINSSNYYHVDIYLKDKPKITVNAFLDTGNKLTDPYTKKSIIIISKNKIIGKLNNPLLVPYNTIDNHGLLECYPVEKIYIDKVGYKTKVLIAPIDEIGIEGADCILNQKLLERIWIW